MSKNNPTGTKLQFTDLYVRNLSNEVLKSLKLMYFDSLTFEEKTKDDYLLSKPLTAENLQLVNQITVTPKPKVPKPSVANETTNSVRLNDFERYNKKRTSDGSTPLTEEEFENAMDNLSISGSDDSEEETEDDFYQRETKLEGINEEETLESSVSFLNTRSPFVLFKSDLLPKGKCFATYKTALEATTNDADPSLYIKNLNSPLKKAQTKSEMSALFMIGGGHFAGGIVSHQPIITKGNQGTPQELQLQSVQLLQHKTYHRYTTRRKQGGSQSAMDNAKGKANSAGSNLRRYNEQTLQQEVRELLALWKPYLDQCQNIFIKASGASGHKSLVGYPGAPIASHDKRVKVFPFTTKRPTTSELKRAWVELNYLSIRDIPSSSKSIIDKQEKQKELLEKSKKQQKKTTKVVDSTSSDPNVKVTQDLIALLKKSKAPALVSYIKKNKIDVNLRLSPESLFYNTPTMLHYASHHGLNHMVQILLNNLKADPTIKNSHGKVAAEVALGQQTTFTFEIVREKLGESYCDWVNEAKVENIKTKEEVDNLNKLESEKQSQEIRQLHTQELENFKKQLDDDRTKKYGRGKAISNAIPRIAEEQNLNSLTPEQKLRVMREQRARAAEARLKQLSSK